MVNPWDIAKADAKCNMVDDIPVINVHYNTQDDTLSDIMVFWNVSTGAFDTVVTLLMPPSSSPEHDDDRTIYGMAALRDNSQRALFFKQNEYSKMTMLPQVYVMISCTVMFSKGSVSTAISFASTYSVDDGKIVLDSTDANAAFKSRIGTYTAVVVVKRTASDSQKTDGNVLDALFLLYEEAPRHIEHTVQSASSDDSSASQDVELNVMQPHGTSTDGGGGKSAISLSAIYALCPNGIVLLEDAFGLESEEERDCLVCLTEPRSIMLLPCRHLCICHRCLTMLPHDTCPVCRTSFGSYLRFDVDDVDDAIEGVVKPSTNESKRDISNNSGNDLTPLRHIDPVDLGDEPDTETDDDIIMALPSASSLSESGQLRTRPTSSTSSRTGNGSTHSSVMCDARDNAGPST